MCCCRVCVCNISNIFLTSPFSKPSFTLFYLLVWILPPVHFFPCPSLPVCYSRLVSILSPPFLLWSVSYNLKKIDHILTFTVYSMLRNISTMYLPLSYSGLTFLRCSWRRGVLNSRTSTVSLAASGLRPEVYTLESCLRSFILISSECHDVCMFAWVCLIYNVVTTFTCLNIHFNFKIK